MTFEIKNQSGASVLEFLIVIPVILLFAYLAIEFGAIFVRANTVTKSVQSAARYLSDVHIEGDAPEEITRKETNAKNLIRYASIIEGTQILPGTFSSLQVTQNYGTNNDHVLVEVVYQHEPVVGQAVTNLLRLVTGTDLGDNYFAIDIPASSVMRYAQ